MKNLTHLFFVTGVLLVLFPGIALNGAHVAILPQNSLRDNCETFLEACRSGDVVTLERLLPLDNTHLDIDFCDESGESALHLAVINEHPAVCALLLESEIDLHIRNVDNETALRRAALQNNHAILEEFRKGKVIGTVEENSQKLLTACDTGNLDEVQELLELVGSDYLDINETDVQGNSALHLAVLSGHARICDVLIANGIDTEIHNNDTFTALHLAHERAVTEGDDEVLEVIKNGATTEDIMENLIAFASDNEGNGSDDARAGSESDEFLDEDNNEDTNEDPLSGISW